MKLKKTQTSVNKFAIIQNNLNCIPMINLSIKSLRSQAKSLSLCKIVGVVRFYFVFSRHIGDVHMNMDVITTK